MATAQFEVVEQATVKPNQALGRLALFDENGDPIVIGGGGETTVAWDDVTDKPAVIAAGADAAAARTAIGAGTSSLALGTTSSTAKAGNYTPTSTEVGNALKAKTQIAALVADLVPAEATEAECATKINEIIAALKA